MENAAGKEIELTKKIAQKVLSEKKIALFIVAYNAQNHIQKTIERIPVWCRDLFAEIYVIDDSSKDSTFEEALEAGKNLGFSNFKVMKTPSNQGYGGNQKIGYTYAIDKNYDIVILLHGDGQYPPEALPKIVAGYANTSVDAVFGSRMMTRFGALKGGMPLYKWFGNQILTRLENFILGTNLSEFHSGYRSYRIDVLKKIPFQLNSNDFHFDTDIIIQLALRKGKILEIPMPTHYGDEECHVNGTKYAWNCIKSALKSRLHQAGVFFQPNFEIPDNDMRNYSLKKAKTSLHSNILSLQWKENEQVADIGANDCMLSMEISNKGPLVTAADINIPEDIEDSEKIKTLKTNLNGDFDLLLGKERFDKVVALDVIEHLHSPESSVQKLHNILKKDGMLYASTANIGYIVMRLTLLLGWFNYGKRGILDRTHHRLFTISSFGRILQNAGFGIIKIEGFGPPIVDAFGDSFFWKTLDRLCYFLARLYPPLFAFNFLVTCRKKLSVEEKTKITIESSGIIS